MPIEEDLELAIALEKSLKEFLPDFKIYSGWASFNNIKLECKKLDLICYVTIRHASIRIMRPKSLKAVTLLHHTQKMKTTELTFADPSFSIEKLADIIRNGD